MVEIFTAVNNLYYPHLKIFMHSYKKHNREPVRLTVLYADLSENNRKDLIRYCKKTDFGLRLIEADREKVKGYKLLKHTTAETYFRFMMLEIYPEEERALWIDVDTVVLGNIALFYNIDFEGCYTAGTPEQKGKLDIERLKLNPSGCYFNAGVVLYNLKKIREDFSSDFLYRLYEEHKDNIRFADQDILNIAFSHKTKRLEDGTYNYMVRSGADISIKELRKISKEVKIIHFIRSIKPWHRNYIGAVRLIYLRAMFPLYPLKAISLLPGCKEKQ